MVTLQRLPPFLWPLSARVASHKTASQGRQFLKSIINSCLPSAFDDLLILLLWKETLFFEAAADLEAISIKTEEGVLVVAFLFRNWKNMEKFNFNSEAAMLVKNNPTGIGQKQLFRSSSTMAILTERVPFDFKIFAVRICTRKEFKTIPSTPQIRKKTVINESINY